MQYKLKIICSELLDFNTDSSQVITSCKRRNVFTGVCLFTGVGISVWYHFLSGWLGPMFLLGVSISGLIFLLVGGRRSLSRGISVWGDVCPRGSCQGNPRTVTSERYASYWNAFLFEECFVLRFYSMNVVNNFKNSVKQHNVTVGRNRQSFKINHHWLSQYFVSSTISIPAHSTTGRHSIFQPLVQPLDLALNRAVPLQAYMP